MVVRGCAWLCVVIRGYSWLFVVMRGYGWLWVVYAWLVMGGHGRGGLMDHVMDHVMGRHHGPSSTAGVGPDHLPRRNADSNADADACAATTPNHDAP